jgi:hypothetical protein
MKRYALAVALAMASISTAACTLTTAGGSTPATSIGAMVSTPQGQAALLGAGYAGLKATFAIYAASPIADQAVVAAVNKAITVADVAIPKAQADIVAASTQDGLTTALKAGQDALAVFEQALITYGVKPAVPAPAASSG